MRVRITFKVKNRGGLVPFHHQYLIAQILRGLILASRNKEFVDFHFYNFSGLKGQTKVSRAGLHYNSNKVTIVLSSANETFINFLVKEILDQHEVRIGNLVVSPETVDEELPVSLSNETKFICISPLVLIPASFNNDDAKRFIDPGSDEFSDLLFESTLNRMEDFGIDINQIREAQKFQVIPDEGYLNKLRDQNKKFARIYPLYDQDVKFEVRGYTFPFTLFAAPEIQRFLFTCGLGYYGHKGFGMLDVAHADPTQRLVAHTDNRNSIIA